MSEVCAPRYLAGLVSTHGQLRSRHLCQTPLNGWMLNRCVPGCQAGIAPYMHAYMFNEKCTLLPFTGFVQQAHAAWHSMPLHISVLHKSAGLKPHGDDCGLTECRELRSLGCLSPACLMQFGHRDISTNYFMAVCAREMVAAGSARLHSAWF